jgi:hypothetical protein
LARSTSPSTWRVAAAALPERKLGVEREKAKYAYLICLNHFMFFGVGLVEIVNKGLGCSRCGLYGCHGIGIGNCLV